MSVDERPPKRIRLDEDVQDSAGRSGHTYHTTRVGDSGTVHQGDNHIHNYYSDKPRDLPQLEDERSKLLIKSLLFDRIDSRKHSVKRALVKTCRWLFEHPTYIDWESAQSNAEHNGFLWLKGKPGCGKSTLMKMALDRMQKSLRKQRKKPIVLSYFFHGRAANALEKSSLGLYRSFVHQLVQHSELAKRLFCEKFANKYDFENDEVWTKEELCDFLCDLAEDLEEPLSLYLFIDALDESEYHEDVREMIEHLIDLSDRALMSESQFQVQICLSSRHFPYIRASRGSEIVVEDQQGHEGDIDQYIHDKLRGPENELKGTLREELRRKSASVFQWVVLVVEMLNQIADRGTLLRDMRTALDGLPSDLDRLYQRILAVHADSVDKQTSLTLLQWVMYSTRALHPDELYVAVHCSLVSEGQKEDSPVDLPEAKQRDIFIIHHSRGLVEIIQHNPPVVQFIHETVKEFLAQQEGLPSMLSTEPQECHGISHDALKKGCAHYLKTTKIPRELRRYVTNGYNKRSPPTFECLIDTLAFSRYASQFVYTHAEMAEKYGLSQAEFLESIMDEGKLTVTFREWWNIFQGFATCKYSTRVTLLYFTCDQGLQYLTAQLLRMPESSQSIDRRCGRYQFPLHAAYVRRNAAIQEALLRRGACFSVAYPCTEFWKVIFARKDTEILHSILRQSKDIVKLFLEHVFIFACSTDDLELLELLFECGLRADSETYYPRKGKVQLLSIACHEGNLNAAKFVLKRIRIEKVEAKIPFRRILNDVLRNTEKDVTELVQFLLGPGIDLNNQASKRDWPPLFSAIQRGDMAIVQLLLDHKADVHDCDATGQNSLHVSARYGRLESLKILFSLGLDLHRVDKKGRTPIFLAALGGHNDAIALLLDQGSNIEHVDHQGRTPIFEAAASGHISAVAFLLDKGNDPNHVDHHGETPIFEAASRGYTDTVALLLDRKGDPNHIAKDGKSILCKASEHGKAGVVELLLSKGAHFSPNPLYSGECHAEVPSPRVPIALAAGSFREAHRFKADFLRELQKSDDGEALHSEKPIRPMYLMTCELLLTSGADINEDDIHCGTPIQAAAYQCQPEMVKLLLRHNANVNAPSIKYGGILEAACSNRSIGDARRHHVLSLLLQHGADIEPHASKAKDMLSQNAINTQPTSIRLLENAVATNGKLVIVLPPEEEDEVIISFFPNS